MGLVGVTIQDPNLNPPSDWSGLITDVLTYTVRRQINGAGSFNISTRATAQQASQIRTGWKISLKEERIGQNDSITMPEWILRYGRVLSRAYQIDDAGGGIFSVQGETWLGQFINNLIKTRQTFTSSNLSTILSGLISNTGVSASHSEPLRTVSQELDIALNDQTLLANLIKLAELTRTNLRENWNADTWEFTDQDDLPAAGGMLTIGAGDLYLRQVEYADPKQASNIGFGPGQYGVGIIQGIPTVSYDGKDIVNVVVGIGTEWDGSELSLDGATYFDAKYGVSVGLGGDGDPFWYIQDDDSIAAHGPIEFHLVRSDIKNPSDDPTTRAAAKASLLAVTSNELLRRRSETQTISVQVLNGAELGILPGDRVHLRYKGNAFMRGNKLTWLNVDQYFLVVARTDSGNANGIRQVVLDIAAPTLVYTIPDVPTAVSIPTPMAPIFPHDPIPFDPGPPGGDYNTALPPLPALPNPDNMALDSFNPMVDMFKNLTEGNGAYQPCCADPTTDIHAGVVGPVGSGGSSPWDTDPDIRGGILATSPQISANEAILLIGYGGFDSGLDPDITVNADATITVISAPQDYNYTGTSLHMGIYLIIATGASPVITYGGTSSGLGIAVASPISEPLHLEEQATDSSSATPDGAVGVGVSASPASMVLAAAATIPLDGGDPSSLSWSLDHNLSGGDFGWQAGGDASGATQTYLGASGGGFVITAATVSLSQTP